MSKARDNREYEIPLHKYVGRNWYTCPRPECQISYDDDTALAIHLKQCCPGLLDKFPTYASRCFVDDGTDSLLNTPGEIRQHVLAHPPLAIEKK